MLVFEKPRWARGIGVRGSAEMRTSVRVGDYLRRVPGAATHPKTALRSRRCRRPRATESADPFGRIEKTNHVSMFSAFPPNLVFWEFLLCEKLLNLPVF